jgi:hypothetical protein
MTAAEFDSIWEHVSQRPVTAGKVFIVRRQKPPVGIGRYEYLQGKRLPTRTQAVEGEEGGYGEGGGGGAGGGAIGGGGRFKVGGQDGGIIANENSHRSTRDRQRDETYSDDVPCRPYTAPRMRRVKFCSHTLMPLSACSTNNNKQRPYSHTGVRRDKELGGYSCGDGDFNSTTTTPRDVDCSRDLVVTSLSLSARNCGDDSEIRKTVDEDGENNRGETRKACRPGSSMTETSLSRGSGEQKRSSHRPKTAAPSSSSSHSGSRFSKASKQQNHHYYYQNDVDTIEGIKRSFLRRAKSAPPNHTHYTNLPTNIHTSTLNDWNNSHISNTSSGKPSYYWRARSAYHKKLMTYDPEAEDDERPDTAVTLRGSLWRPLLLTEEDGGGGRAMQHSAGCPYKCKGCFKACLASEAFLDKARAEKLLREKERARQPLASRRIAQVSASKR